MPPISIGQSNLVSILRLAPAALGFWDSLMLLRTLHQLSCKVADLLTCGKLIVYAEVVGYHIH